MDLAAVARALGSTLLSSRPLTGGISATVTAITLADGRTAVIRQPPRRRDLEPERRLLECLAAQDIPVARPLACGEGWIANALVDGEADLGPADLEAFARQLAAIHAVPLSALDPLPERRLELEESTSDLQHALRAALGPPPPHTPTLLHGDYWPGNLLWRAGRVVAVLDWEVVARGDPRSDVATARLELLWSRGPDAMHEFTRSYGTADDRALAAWDIWAAHAKLRRVPHWPLPAPELARMQALLERFARDAIARRTG